MRKSDVEIIVPKSQEEWLNYKKKTVGGSEVAAVLGLNPYQSPRDVFLLKTGRTEFAQPTLSMLRGTYFEHALVELWAHEEKHTVIKSSQKNILYFDKKYPFLSCTPDRVFLHKNGGKRTLEVKTTFGRYDEPLTQWLYQLQYCMSFTKHDYGELLWEYPQPTVVYKCLEFEKNEEAQKIMREYVCDWWNTYIVKDIEPPPINSNDILGKFPTELAGKITEATQEIAVAYTNIKILQENISTATKEMEAEKEKVKLFMQDSEYITYDSTKLFSWKANKNGSRIFRVL